MSSSTGISNKLNKTRRVVHSQEFQKIRALAKAKRTEMIKTIIHADPLLVFWVTPTGQVVDAGEAHRDNPPGGDKSIFTDSKYKGHLRGRAALIGSTVYIVIYYSVGAESLSSNQFALLRRTYPRILEILVKKHSDLTERIQDAAFIGEDGAVLAI